jgi:hypothetical protein
LIQAAAGIGRRRISPASSRIIVFSTCVIAFPSFPDAMVAAIGGCTTAEMESSAGRSQDHGHNWPFGRQHTSSDDEHG